MYFSPIFLITFRFAGKKKKGWVFWENLFCSSRTNYSSPFFYRGMTIFRHCVQSNKGSILHTKHALNEIVVFRGDQAVLPGRRVKPPM
jgi:hypothetical protein